MAFDYLEKLNREQKDAATTIKGPLLIIAGAGSGKTTVLINRLRYMVDNGISSKNILMLTFTKEAADNMLKRASKLGSDEDNRFKDVTACTYHSFCAKVLRQYYSVAGISADFTVMSDGDCLDAIKLVKNELNLGKEKLLTSEKILEIRSYGINTHKKIRKLVNIFTDSEYKTEMVMTIIRGYEQYKKDHNCFDYDDLLIMMNRLLRNAEVRHRLCEQYKYIMVDEYQDTNGLQESIVLTLAHRYRNLAVVGDDYQSIYRFRGSDINNILNFPQKMPGCKQVILDTNYRSTKNILDVANIIMKDNARFGYPKQMKDANCSGKLPNFVTTDNSDDEVEDIFNNMKTWLKLGKDPSEFAVLSRTSKETSKLEAMIVKEGWDYIKYGGKKFFELKCVRDVMCFCEAYVNPTNELAWYHILDLIPGIGEKNAQIIISDLGTDLFLTNPKYTKRNFADYLAKFRQFWDELKGTDLDTTSLFDRISNHYWYLRNEQLDKFNGDFDNKQKLEEQAKDDHDSLDRLKEIMSEFSSVKGFLDDMLLSTKPSRKETGFVLSTIHSAKGLEWESVSIMNVKDGIIPSYKDDPYLAYEYDADEVASDNDGIMEDLRGLYVAITRAKKYLNIYSPVCAEVNGNLYTDECPFLKTAHDAGLFTKMAVVNEKPERIYLYVPFSLKDTAKEKGAKFDFNTKQWYIYSDNPNKTELLRRFG